MNKHHRLSKVGLGLKSVLWLAETVLVKAQAGRRGAGLTRTKFKAKEATLQSQSLLLLAGSTQLAVVAMVTLAVVVVVVAPARWVTRGWPALAAVAQGT